MTTTTYGRIAAWTLALMLAGATMALAADEAAPAAEEEDDAVPAGVSYTFEATASYHNVDKAYFAPLAYHWGEGFARARGFYGFGKGAYVTAGGVVMATVKKDYYDIEDANDGLLDQLAISLPNIGESGVSLTIGRQSMILGDGFLIGDGYKDHFAASWNIPLTFYDGVLANWTRGPHHLTAFGADISPSFAVDDVRPEGFIAGAEFGWSPSEGNELALAYIRRNDSSEIDYNPQAFSLRGSWTKGMWSAAGEGVLESGTQGELDMAGKGGHASLTWTGEGRFKPTASVEYFYFSGDDPETDGKYEGYDPWQFTWADWSRYYVGDLLGSTIGTSVDTRALVAQCGLTLREGTGLRVLAHRFDRLQSPVKPFAYEIDAVLDQSIGEHFSGYLMGAYAKPIDNDVELYSETRSTQLFASITYKFSGKLAK